MKRADDSLAEAIKLGHDFTADQAVLDFAWKSESVREWIASHERLRKRHFELERVAANLRKSELAAQQGVTRLSNEARQLRDDLRKAKREIERMKTGAAKPA